MHDAKKTKEQLIDELAVLRQRCAALETVLSLSPSPPPAGARDHAWYRHVVEHGQGLICLHDLDGVLLFINPAAARALGYEPHEGIGEKAQPVSGALDTAPVPCLPERIDTSPPTADLMRVLTKNGQERVWAYHNIRYEEAGQPPYVLGHAQDITELVAARGRVATGTH
jgi:PAS domain S-box-containing protein